jgi:CRP-like cAMP-binding protein
VQHQQNHLLALLPAEELEVLAPHLAVVQLNHGEVLVEAHDRIRRVYFPYGGIISCVVSLHDGGTIETGMIGRDGAMGASQALDEKISLNKVVVQVADKMAVIDPDRLRKAVEQCPVLRSALIRYELFFVAQVQQTAACNATHKLEQRMCRWLLRMHELIGADLPLTQQFLSQMIGVTRSHLSVVAGTLQKAGLIAYNRGHIRIVNLEGLRQEACECDHAVRHHHHKIFGGALFNGTDQKMWVPRVRME